MSPPVESTTKNDERKVSQRRINKPLIEKRRRARINDCLAQLKTIVLESTSSQTPRPSKLEKADILEMTVEFIKKRSHVPDPPEEDRKEANNYQQYVTGYASCLKEVSGFLEKSETINSELKKNILDHIAGKINSQQKTSSTEQHSEEFKPDISQTCTEITKDTKKKVSSSQTQDKGREANTYACVPNVQQKESPKTQPVAPMGVLCGGQVLLLVQLPPQQVLSSAAISGQPTIPVISNPQTNGFVVQGTESNCASNSVTNVGLPVSSLVRGENLIGSNAVTGSLPPFPMHIASQSGQLQQDTPGQEPWRPW